MAKMTNQNLQNIKDRFELETGASLEKPRPSLPRKRLVLLTAVLAVGMLLAAFTSPLFTPLNGDELNLSGTYMGDGIVSIHVENRSDRVLEFTAAKLFSWNDGEVEPLPDGHVQLSNTRFAPHSEGELTVNLSDAYDIAYLETTLPGKPRDSWYYLLLTNHSFLFGHDWMCSFHFVEEQEIAETQPGPVDNPEAQTIEKIGEELQFYFRDAYYEDIPAFNQKNFEYQQKVQELLMRREGTLVHPMDPLLFVKEADNFQVGQHHGSLDGYNRMVGASFSGVTSDFVLQLSGLIPEEGNSENGQYMPLVYFVTYDTQAVKQEGAYAFLSGQILPFAELEGEKVYEDEQYVIYEVTKLFYTDLDAYIDTFASGYGLTVDDRTRQGLHEICAHYRDHQNLDFSYLIPEE